MRHPLEVHADEVFARLRAFRGRVPLSSRQHVIPGVWVEADSERGRIEIDAFDPSEATPQEQSGPANGGLLGLDVRVATPGRWLSLNIALDHTPLVEGDVLGLVADMRCDAPAQIAVTVRSSHGGTAEDIRFPDQLGIGPAGTTRVTLLDVTAVMALTRPPEWRNLMLWLPQKTMRLTLADMRLFLAPAGS